MSQHGESVINMSILRGMATINYFAADHEAAKAWFSELLGVEPYFKRPGYAEFRIGDHKAELRIIDAACAPHDVSTPGGGVLYWAVDDLPAMLQRLMSMGAKEHQPIIDRGGGRVS